MLTRTIDYKKLPTIAIKSVLYLEWIWIAIMIFAFWHISPPIRDQYVFLLVFAIPIYLARYIGHRRLFTRTPLDVLLMLFAILTVYNFHNAPLSRADYWVLVCRPFLGILTIWYFAEHVRSNKHLRYLITVTIIVGIVVGIIALTASQWGASTKSDSFKFILDILPRLDHKQILPDMQLSFNPNEIAGALAYFCPFLLAISLKTFCVDSPQISTRFNHLLNIIERWGALVGFILTFSALFLGQSRFALAGTLVGLFIVIVFVLPNWKFKLAGLSLWGIVVVIELLLIFNIIPLDLSPNSPATSEDTIPSTTLSNRDEYSLSSRFEMWERALWMMRDYPTTGAGMSTYRAMVTREAYEIPSYVERGTRPPHAHNALLQVGADLGIVGLILFSGWYIMVIYMSLYIFKNGNLNSTIMTIAITSSILSYIGYGLGDTITLWDRFAFIHWWYIGLITAVYVNIRYSSPSKND